MQLDIRRVRNSELSFLCELDQKIFSPPDAFDSPELWEDLEIFFITVNGIPVGSTAFQHNCDVADTFDSESLPDVGSVYLVTTGLLPEWRHLGIGKKVKAWQIRYARDRQFKRIVTNVRASNRHSIHLNKQFGFVEIKRTPCYYTDPDEEAVVLELNLISA